MYSAALPFADAMAFAATVQRGPALAHRLVLSCFGNLYNACVRGRSSLPFRHGISVRVLSTGFRQLLADRRRGSGAYASIENSWTPSCHGATETTCEGH